MIMVRAAIYTLWVDFLFRGKGIVSGVFFKRFMLCSELLESTDRHPEGQTDATKCTISLASRSVITRLHPLDYFYTFQDGVSHFNRMKKCIHPVQEKTTLWVHPLKNDNVGSTQLTLWVQTHRHSFRTHFVIFFNDEPVGSFSLVQGGIVNIWCKSKCVLYLVGLILLISNKIIASEYCHRKDKSRKTECIGCMETIEFTPKFGISFQCLFNDKAVWWSTALSIYCI